ncbi:MAG: hypothetical protein FGF52_06100 [Candidatus Brockarchaeota archaeon]|nr:hypothetical protein [Candidatus Brockarchaeota archaeon]
MTYRNLDDNSTMTRLIKPFLNTSVVLDNQTLTQGLSLNVTVPEHEQEIVTIVPEHVEKFKILFPKYTIRIKVFLTMPNRSSWWMDFWQIIDSYCELPVGYELTIFYETCPMERELLEDDPLNAILRVETSAGLQINFISPS